MLRACVFSVSLAALAAGAVSTEAFAQTSRRQVSGGPTVVVGSTRARDCYEDALMDSDSTASLAGCDGALTDPLTRHNRVATLVNRSIVLANRGQLADALDDLETALERAPEMAAIHVNFGDVYLKLGQWADAEASFTRAIDLNFARPQIAYYARGVAREEQGDVAGAYADYTMASRLAPDWDLPARELVRFQVVGEGEAPGGA